MLFSDDIVNIRDDTDAFASLLGRKCPDVSIPQEEKKKEEKEEEKRKGKRIEEYLKRAKKIFQNFKFQFEEKCVLIIVTQIAL